MKNTHEFHLSLQADHPASASRTDARAHTLSAPDKPPLSGSSAPAFHGDSTKWNPEELFAAALVQCHYLSYLYVAGVDGLQVQGYTCQATATLSIGPGGGQITRVELFPDVQVQPGHEELAQRLHERAHQECFIARSVSCEVVVTPTVHAV